MKIIKPLSGLLLLVGMFYVIDINEVQSIIFSIDITKMLFAIFFGILGNLITIFRWQLILKLMYGNFKFAWLLGIFGQSLSLNSVLPGGIVGGDVFRSYSVATKLPKGNKKIGPKSVIVDRFSGFWSITFISMISGFVILITVSFGKNHTLFAYYLAFLVVLSLGPFITRVNIKQNLSEKFKLRSNYIVIKVTNLFKLVRTGSNYLAATFLLSLMTQLFAVFNFWYCLQAVQIDIPMLQLLFCSTFIFLSSVIPISIAGFGPREFGSVAILSLYGFVGEALIVASILYGLTTTFQGFLGLFWFLRFKKDLFEKS